MSLTYTTTETWSRTHARYIAGKVGADLRQMQQEYGEPTDKHLNDLVEELVTYLADDYLDYVEYGFRRGDTWVVAHKYTAGRIGSMAADDRSGRVRRGASSPSEKNQCMRYPAYLSRVVSLFCGKHSRR